MLHRGGDTKSGKESIRRSLSSGGVFDRWFAYVCRINRIVPRLRFAADHHQRLPMHELQNRYTLATPFSFFLCLW
jgi:hypothetical protein